VLSSRGMQHNALHSGGMVAFVVPACCVRGQFCMPIHIRNRSISADVADPGCVTPARWHMYTGHDQVVALKPQLQALVERCSRTGTMDYLEYFLQVPYFPSERPRRTFARSSALLAKRARVPKLLVKSGPKGLKAAVILFEYYAFGVPTGLYVSSDLDGWRTVIAPAERRSTVAEEAAEHLLVRGANLILISYNRSELSSPDELEAMAELVPETVLHTSSPRLKAIQMRPFGRTLPLCESFDATLATMGAHTRRNLRASQRRAVKELGAVYIADAELSLDEFLRINRACTYTVADRIAEWRYRSARSVKGGVFAGLRAADGRWMSFVGGRRLRETVAMDWQMNLKASGSLSLVTAMRALFLADEVERGMRWMRFEGGTTHSIQSAFLPEQATDLMFVRRGLSRKMLRYVGELLPTGGLLAETLLSDTLVWRGEA